MCRKMFDRTQGSLNEERKPACRTTYIGKKDRLGWDTGWLSRMILLSGH